MHWPHISTQVTCVTQNMVPARGVQNLDQTKPHGLDQFSVTNWIGFKIFQIEKIGLVQVLDKKKIELNQFKPITLI